MLVWLTLINITDLYMYMYMNITNAAQIPSASPVLLFTTSGSYLHDAQVPLQLPTPIADVCAVILWGLF